MKYLSLFSGIEAASLACREHKWEPVAFAEIEKFPSSVLAQRFPNVPNLGDVTKVNWEEFSDSVGHVDLVVFGSPCQSFSIAGKRLGLDDPRGNLALYALYVVSIIKPRWFVFENVPGLLSSSEGRDFGLFLRQVDELGYSGAWRLLDAQYIRTRNFPYAVPQRRRRLFFVGYLGDWRRAAAVLLDAESLRGNPPPRREAGKDPTRTLRARANSSHREDSDNFVAECAPTLNAHFGDKMGLENQHINQGGGCSLPPVAMCLNAHGARMDAESETLLPTTGGVFDVAHTLKAEGFDASEEGTGRGTPIVPVAFDTTQITSPGNYSQPKPGDPCHPLAAGAHPPAVAFDMRGREGGAMPEGPHDTASIRAASGGSSRSYVAQPWAVRRLTPTECERLMGFPDDWTAIEWRGKSADQCPDGPRYKALGNSWAVNSGEYIFDRIKMVEEFFA